MIIKKLLAIFTLSFLFNWLWENLHSYLYANYQGGEITQLILLRATLFDAVFITILGLIFTKISYFNKRPVYLIIFSLVAAVAIEIFALKTGRWAYNESMPIIPLINTGFTPTIQLAIIFYLVITILPFIVG